MENQSSNMQDQRQDFKFAFKDTTFCDRILRIEIMADSLDSYSDSEGGERKAENSDYEIVADVKTLPISSVIFAASSPFFYKLFTNGMRESQERDNVTLRINASDEAALMDVMSFMYNITLSATTAHQLLHVLIVADKFEVISCVKYCSEQLLQNVPMSQESAVLYLELHSTVFVGEVIQPLIDAAKQYLLARYRDFFMSQGDAMVLPLCAIEVILTSDALTVRTEDDVFKFIMEWAQEHYPESEERLEILTKCFTTRLIRFPYLSYSTILKQVCTEFDQKEVSNLVQSPLSFKAKGQKYTSASTDLAAANCGFTARAYVIQPVKVVRFKIPRPQCVVYFDLKKEVCADLLTRKILLSEFYALGGRQFMLLAICAKNQQSSPNHFSLYVMTAKSSAACTLDYEFSVMKSTSVEFQSIHKVNSCNLQDMIGEDPTWVVAGKPNLFSIPWNDFMAADSVYFVDGYLHLRAEFTMET